MYKPLLIFFLLVVVYFGVSGGVTEVVAATKINKTEKERIKEAIITYFSLRYSALKTNQPIDFSTSIVSQDFKTAEWIKLEADRRDVEMRIHKQ
jgi:hypothetical protein